MVYIVYVRPAVLESSEMKTSRNKQDDNGLDAVLPIMTYYYGFRKRVL